jgi:polar amino acid transport system ATP-binding protein
MLNVAGLHKVFAGRVVLSNVSFSVAAGETVAVIGPSGSGKTTMLRCLNHLEQPDAGRIILDCVDIGAAKPGRDLAKARRGFGFVFQRFNLFAHLTALDNVALGPVLSLGIPKRQAREAAMARLEQVLMAAHAAKRPAQLSGGQQQRVAIARALAMKPRMILYDEPTSALDPELVAEVLDVMGKLARDGMTSLVVTHEIGFARQVADRVIFMADGRIVESGPARAVIDAPAEEQTRRFLAHFHLQRADVP